MIESLASDPRLDQLERYRRATTFLTILRRGREEVYHSRLIAYLLDSRQSELAPFLVRQLLRHVLEARDEIPAYERSDMERLMASERLESRAYTERWRIDVVLEIRSPLGRAVLGIENKVDAIERPRQLADYQGVLAREYELPQRAMLFLTPDARDAETADPASGVPCISLGYEELSEMLERALDETASCSASLWEVASNLLRHWREEIVGVEELRELVLGLWRDHPKAMRLAVQYRPRLDDVKDRIIHGMQERAPWPLEVTTWPRTGPLKEIKFLPQPWEEGGLPLTLMFSQLPGKSPELRLLMWHHTFPMAEPRLRSWARDVVDSGIDLPIDEEFPRVAGWHEILRADPEEDGGDLGGIWDAEGAERALAIAGLWLEALEPVVRRHLGPEVA